MAIADVYDTLVSKRPYKNPFSPKDAADIIREGGGVHFDPKLVDIFIKIMDEFAEISKITTD